VTTGEVLLISLIATPIGWIALLWIAALVAAILVPKKPSKKIIAVLVVLTFAVMPIAYIGWDQETRKARSKAEYERLNAIFMERCKNAGEKILRTASDVDGVVLLKVRPQQRNTTDQFAMTDPYGDDLPGDAYIQTFLRTYNAIATEPPRQLGYDYVDVRDPTSGEAFRYTGEITPRKDSEFRPTFKLVKSPLRGEIARYGVTYDDISTREDREHWIAGSSLRIVDLTTNEVMAERIGYMIDMGQGMRGGGSEPWERAAHHACPKFAGWPPSFGQTAQAARFASKVLTPPQGR
jgi:hypothetical protein